MLWEAMSNTRKNISSSIQTLQSWLKKTRLRLFFSTHFSVFGYLRKHSSLYERYVIWSAVFEIKLRCDPRTCWTIWAIVSWTWKIQVTQRDSNPWPLLCRCSALTNWATKSHSWEQQRHRRGHSSLCLIYYRTNQVKQMQYRTRHIRGLFVVFLSASRLFLKSRFVASTSSSKWI